MALRSAPPVNPAWRLPARRIPQTRVVLASAPCGSAALRGLTAPPFAPCSPRETNVFHWPAKAKFFTPKENKPCLKIPKRVAGEQQSPTSWTLYKCRLHFAINFQHAQIRRFVSDSCRSGFSLRPRPSERIDLFPCLYTSVARRKPTDASARSSSSLPSDMTDRIDLRRSG